MRVSINKLTGIIAILCFVFCSTAFADMRVCINKTTGKLIEAQSGGKTHPNVNNEEYALANLEVLRQNAINAGYKKEDIEVKFVTDEEFEAIPRPEVIKTEEQLNEEKINKKTRELAIKELIAEGKLPAGYE